MAYWLLKAILTPILRFFYRVRVDGRRSVPRRGPVILASNHLSFCDSIFLPLVVHRRVTFVAKAEYFEQRRTAWFFRAMGQIPIKRGGGAASQRALETAKDVLAAGRVFGIYPEGTRSPDGKLYKGHSGVARLALECGVPVVAVAMVGTAEVQPIGQVMPRLFRPIGVRFSAPMDFSALRGRADDPAVLRQVTDTVMAALQRLSGQEYVDVYAKRRKEEMDRAAAATTPPAAGSLQEAGMVPVASPARAGTA